MVTMSWAVETTSGCALGMTPRSRLWREYCELSYMRATTPSWSLTRRLLSYELRCE